MFKTRNIGLSVLCILFILSCSDKEKVADENSINDFEFLEITIPEIREKLDEGELSVVDLTQAYIERIEAIDQAGPQLNSVIMINPDALLIAQELDDELQAGKIRGPLHGIPILLKDNIDTKDKMPTTAGSRALENSFPLSDSWVTKKLRAAGAVILGKANLSEWANFRGELSSSGWSGLVGQTKNPYILDRNPCGSSSGSGVSVSANLCMIAIGTETNGSIVCPANNNGVVGIKPTVGLISRSGIIPISYTQDTAGPMARTLTDAVIALGSLTGVDSADEKTTASLGKSLTDYTPYLKTEGLKNKRIGIYKRPLGRHYKVDTLFYQAVEFIKSQGAEVIEIDNITKSNVGGHSFQVMLYEYKEGLNAYFKSLGPDAEIKDLEELIEFNKKDSIELLYHDQKYLEMANEKSGLDDQEYTEALNKLLIGSREDGLDSVMNAHQLDAIIAPTGGPAWKTDLVNGDSFHLGSSSPAARSGYPNITVPMGFINELPVGISFFGRAWSEPLLIEIAYAYEQGTMHRKAPKYIPTD
ncbi:MAG: amidase [Flavobacteriaceae bacterium]|nr:amidase [Flavobacteriaceae bacterium]